MIVYVVPALPRHWVILDRNGQHWLVDDGPNAWHRRRPYHGSYQLRQALPLVASAVLTYLGLREDA